jgi:hypothetical protein
LLADIITSLKFMLNDFMSMVCFYSSGCYSSLVPVTCNWLTNVNYTWLLLPYWFRFWQATRRWTCEEPHLTN